MRTFFFTLVICILAISVSGQTVGIGTTTPNASAILDVSSSNLGFLPPRVALTSTNVASPITNPAIGLLVYNTATTGIAPNNVVPGYYYWDGTRWYPVINRGSAVGDMEYWDGTKWIMIPLGANNSVLTICQGIPTWGGCPAIVISPTNNPTEGQINVALPNAWFAPVNQFLIEAWTSGGNPFTVRECVKFDYSAIPFGSVIDSAKLYLYADPTPANGNMIDAMFGSSNSCYVQRITTPWVGPTPFTWNSPPAFTTTNQAIIPQSTSSFENSVVDVTALVKDMLTNGNNGFYIKLVNEVTYNSRQYLSSSSSDPTKHPKLIIKYH